jgi:hypothetical protein
MAFAVLSMVIELRDGPTRVPAWLFAGQRVQMLQPEGVAIPTLGLLDIL